MHSKLISDVGNTPAPLSLRWAGGCASVRGGEMKPKRLEPRLKLHGVMRDAGSPQSSAAWALIGSDGWRIKVGGGRETPRGGEVPVSARSGLGS